jgi:hypothetical protein
MSGPEHDDGQHELTVKDVDRREPGPTEPDEEQVLADLYGPADADGVHRGDGDR